MTPKGTTKRLDQHAINDLLPYSKNAVRLIAANMRQGGFDPRHPILLYDGKILDGRHRYEAALAAGVEPVFQEFRGTEAEARRKSIALNRDRRHLTQAEIICLSYEYEQLMDEASRRSNAAIARELNVSPAAVSRTLKALKNAPDGPKAHKKLRTGVSPSSISGRSPNQTKWAISKGRCSRVDRYCEAKGLTFAQGLRDVLDAGLRALDV